jgi:hypothetical protein
MFTRELGAAVTRIARNAIKRDAEIDITQKACYKNAQIRQFRMDLLRKSILTCTKNNVESAQFAMKFPKRKEVYILTTATKLVLSGACFATDAMLG